VELGENGALQIGPAIDDEQIYTVLLADACGSRSQDWVNTLLLQMANAGNEGKASNAAGAVKAGLAFINGLAPRNEVESALGAQMFAAHSLAMHMARRAESLEHMDWIKMAADQMNKASRTYIAGVEALGRLRNGGKQQVEVRYVYVNGNAVLGDVHTGDPGGGAIPGFIPQPHAQLCNAPGAPVPAMWSTNPERRQLQGAGRERAEPVQDARRSESGSAEGPGERQLAPWSADTGDAGGKTEDGCVSA
jgi:hypothetical protein